jgi:hypothetical protein
VRDRKAAVEKSIEMAKRAQRIEASNAAFEFATRSNPMDDTYFTAAHF